MSVTLENIALEREVSTEGRNRTSGTNHMEVSVQVSVDVHALQ
jgi:hypothetical protein